jgi:hypothetical protein
MVPRRGAGIAAGGGRVRGINWRREGAVELVVPPFGGLRVRRALAWDGGRGVRGPGRGRMELWTRGITNGMTRRGVLLVGMEESGGTAVWGPVWQPGRLLWCLVNPRGRIVWVVVGMMVTRGRMGKRPMGRKAWGRMAVLVVGVMMGVGKILVVVMVVVVVMGVEKILVVVVMMILRWRGREVMMKLRRGLVGVGARIRPIGVALVVSVGRVCPLVGGWSEGGYGLDGG